MSAEHKWVAGEEAMYVLGNQGRGTRVCVLAVDDDKAWVRYPSEGRKTVSLAHLTPIRTAESIVEDAVSSVFDALAMSPSNGGSRYMRSFALTSVRHKQAVMQITPILTRLVEEAKSL